jgi:hypothetical protein
MFDRSRVGKKTGRYSFDAKVHYYIGAWRNHFASGQLFKPRRKCFDEAGCFHPEEASWLPVNISGLPPVPVL